MGVLASARRRPRGLLRTALMRDCSSLENSSTDSTSVTDR